MFSTAFQPTKKTQTLPSSPYLHWGQRLPIIQENIHKAFEELKKDTCRWKKNGTYQLEYGLAHIDEYKLVKALIKENPQRLDFYVLDIGAGEFGFGRGLASCLNRDKELPQNIKVHIIGLRGEQHLEEPIHEEGICRSYEYGAFQIENILAEFKSLGLDWKEKMDVIVSAWCFRHVVDPVGTFLQTYTLLRPGTGLLLMDGFFYNCGNRAKDPWGRDKELYLCNVGQLLLLTKAPFLMYGHRMENTLDQFIIKRKDRQEPFLPLSYVGIESVGGGYQIESRCIVKFNWSIPYQGFDYRSANYPQTGFSGDAELYDFLKKTGALEIRSDAPEYTEFHGSFLKEKVNFLASTSDKLAMVTLDPTQREQSIDFKQEEPVVNTSEAKIITSIVVPSSMFNVRVTDEQKSLDQREEYSRLLTEIDATEAQFAAETGINISRQILATALLKKIPSALELADKLQDQEQIPFLNVLSAYAQKVEEPPTKDIVTPVLVKQPEHPSINCDLIPVISFALPSTIPENKMVTPTLTPLPAVATLAIVNTTAKESVLNMPAKTENTKVAIIKWEQRFNLVGSSKSIRAKRELQNVWKSYLVPSEHAENKKDEFLKCLARYLKIYATIDRVELLDLFMELRNKDGLFAFIHQQKNPAWDRFRLLFKRNCNGDSEKYFWHTDTYQKAVKIIKEAYIDKEGAIPASRQQHENGLIDYVRGNAPVHFRRNEN